jgi:hypothetical protein
VRPSALAVFMLITSSNLVGCSTGRSAGLVPLRIGNDQSVAIAVVCLPDEFRGRCRVVGTHAAMGPADKFDLVIKGGEVLDPSQPLKGKRAK